MCVCVWRIVLYCLILNIMMYMRSRVISVGKQLVTNAIQLLFRGKSLTNGAHLDEQKLIN